jgi:hypothetical protein
MDNSKYRRVFSSLPEIETERLILKKIDIKQVIKYFLNTIF